MVQGGRELLDPLLRKSEHPEEEGGGYLEEVDHLRQLLLLI